MLGMTQEPSDCNTGFAATHEQSHEDDHMCSLPVWQLCHLVPFVLPTILCILIKLNIQDAIFSVNSHQNPDRMYSNHA